MLTIVKWQDWANIVIGVWLAASPWALGFTEHEPATMNAVIFGSIMIVLPLLDPGAAESWEE